jgi:hypothetical protein
LFSARAALIENLHHHHSSLKESASVHDNSETESDSMLDLVTGRIIAMQFGARTYTWTFRRILRADWEKFFRSFDTETTTILGEQTETFEIESGMMDLARSCVTSVAGYAMPETGDFRAMLPLGHLRAFGVALRDVSASAADDDAPIALSELAEISLDCTWSENRLWRGLLHRFRPPTLQQQRKFNRACGTYRILGNERGNRTLYPARQALMMNYYDELIESVEGYSEGGAEIGSRRDVIIREMDCAHKVAAVQALLNAGGAGRPVDPEKAERT